MIHRLRRFHFRALIYVQITVIIFFVIPLIKEYIPINQWSVQYNRYVQDADDKYGTFPPPPAAHSRYELWNVYTAIDHGNIELAQELLEKKETSSRIERTRLEGEIAFQQGDYINATYKWLSANDVESPIQLASQLVENKDFIAAINVYKVIVELGMANEGDAHHEIARLYEILDDDESAYVWYQAALEERQSIGWQMQYVRVARRLGKFDVAQHELEDIIATTNDYGPAYLELAWNYHMMGQHDAAVDIVQGTLKHMSNLNASHYLRLGQIYFSAGRDVEARQYYNLVLVSDPENPIALRRLEQLTEGQKN